MWQLAAFWVALAIPGFVLLAAYAREELEGGLLPSLSASYLASLSLLAPLVAVAYWVELPVALLSGAMVLLLLASLALAARRRVWRGLPPLWQGTLLIGLLVLLFHLWTAARVGTWMGGDAAFHVARIRFLLDHGLNNLDIYVSSRQLNGYYHTSLLHALLASVTQLTGLSPLELWHASLPWAKLVIAAGHAQLAASVFGGRTAPWLAAAFALTTGAGVDYALYPNILAGGFILPALLAVGIRAATRPDARAREAVKLAAGVLALSQLHALYGAFLMLCLGPVLALGALLARRQGRPARVSMLCALALLLCIPNAVLVRTLRGEPLSDPPPSHGGMSGAQLAQIVAESQKRWREAHSDEFTATRVERAGGGPLEKELDELPHGGWVASADSVGGLGFALVATLALLWTLWRSRGADRRAVIALLIAGAVPAALLFIPALCTLAVNLAGAPFLVVRLVPLVSSCLFVGLSGGLSSLVPKARPRLVPELLVLAVAVAGTQLRGHAPRLWTEHVQNARESADERLSDLRELRARKALLEEHIPDGSTVLTTLRMARLVVMLHDLHVVAADRGHARIPGLVRRRADVVWMTEWPLSWQARKRLLQHYGIRHAIIRRNEQRLYSWTRGHAQLLGTAAGWRLMRLKVE